MAIDMFLKIDGIKGESKDDKHKDEIHIESYSWGATNVGTHGTGGGGGAGKVSMHDISIMKLIDVSTADLFYHCVSGKHLSTATLFVRKAGEKPLEYLKVKLTDILVSSIQHSGANGSDQLMESLSLNYAKMEIEYTPQNEKGGGGSTSKAGWDIKANKKV